MKIIKKIVDVLFPLKWGVFLRSVDGRYTCRLVRRLGGDMNPHFEFDGMYSGALVTYQREKTFRTLRSARDYKKAKAAEQHAYW